MKQSGGWLTRDCRSILIPSRDSDSMERKPLSTGSVIGAVVLLVVVSLGVYVGGYVALSENSVGHSAVRREIGREYRYDWLACGYRPLTHAERATPRSSVLFIGPLR